MTVPIRPTAPTRTNAPIRQDAPTRPPTLYGTTSHDEASVALRLSAVLAAFLAVAAALVVAAVLPGAASGQTAPDAPLRQGVHFSVGAGGASMSATCASCQVNFFDDRIGGFSGILQLGGAVTPQLVIAGEFMGWMKNDDELDRRVAGLNLVFLGYPSPSSGFFVRGGFGAMRAIVENELVIVQTDAFSGVAGIGVDIPVGAVMFTPYANYIYAFSGETWINDLVLDEAVLPNAFQFGAALTVH